ncbi:MAG: MATE family efflux transporter [Pseudomonadota bacterium]
MSETVTRRRVLAIALPIVLSNATVPLLGAVDTGVIGQLGEAAPIGAVGVGAMILASIYWIFGFLRMGTTGLVAQARGAADGPEAAALLLRGLMIAAVAGLLIVAMSGIILHAAFGLAPASEEVERLAGEYFSLRIWGAPATIALYAVTGWLIAMERARAVLVIQVSMNALNALLDFVFVLDFGWGVRGVATASLIAEWSGLVLGLWYCRTVFFGKGAFAWSRVFDRARLLRMAAVNSDIIIRSILLQASFTSFLFLGAGFGDVTLAANQVLLQFVQITAYTLDGFAFSAEALVGQAAGRRRVTEVRRAAIVCSQWGLVFAVLQTVAYLALGPIAVDLLTTAPEVRDEARTFLIWAAMTPAIGVAAWMLDGIFIGATRTRQMRNAMIVSVAIYAVALLLLLPTLENHGLWASLWVIFCARAVTLGLRYPALERAMA